MVTGCKNSTFSRNYLSLSLQVMSWT